MYNSSSDKDAESKRPRPDCANHEESNGEEQSDYYYDDSTGYEIYEEDQQEELPNRER